MAEALTELGTEHALLVRGEDGVDEISISDKTTLIEVKRAALDRWGKGDPQGFFEIMATDQTYFDPMTEKRIDGQADLKQYMAPFTGKIKIERVEMINPKVQQSGAIAVLTFNLIDHGAQVGDGPKTTARWNSTEVYQRINGSWKIIHSHWSNVKPGLNESNDARNRDARAIRESELMDNSRNPHQPDDREWRTRCKCLVR